MKKIGTYTARGIVTEIETEGGFPQKIPLFDGKFTTAYRVTSFKIWGSNFGSTSTNPDVMGKLSKNDTGSVAASSFFRADDDNQIAWATSASGLESGGAPFAESIVDSDNMIVEDLYVYVRSLTNVPVNYLVTMEKYEISDWQGALTMARDRAQE